MDEQSGETVTVSTILRAAGAHVTYPDQGSPYVAMQDARHGNTAVSRSEPQTVEEARAVVASLRADLSARAKETRRRMAVEREMESE